MVAAATVPAAAATPPSISKITPNVGAPAGGNTVTIKGQNFLPSGSYTDGTDFYVPTEYLTYTDNGQKIVSITTTTEDLIAEARYASSPSIAYEPAWVNLLSLVHPSTNPSSHVDQRIYFQFNNSGCLYTRFGSSNVTLTTIDDHQPHIIKLSMPDKKAWYDGNEINSTTLPISSDGIVAFGGPFIGKLYYINVWKSGLLHTLVPVYNASTNEGGLFDVDDNVFYGSSTSPQIWFS
ncbi:hypothetical protein AGMMS4956_21350 [Bacteroidia bacterium]|nr:hypothetical protein AGMMS4956_21350 [Bacteroidia bacterium]